MVLSSAAVLVEIIRGSSRKPSGIWRKTVRLPAGITVRLLPGILFVFTPERSSRSPPEFRSPCPGIRIFGSKVEFSISQTKQGELQPVLVRFLGEWPD